MRLKLPLATAQEELILLINEGYSQIHRMTESFEKSRTEGTYRGEPDAVLLRQSFDPWIKQTLEALARIFPTQLEQHLFLDPDISLAVSSGERHFQNVRRHCLSMVRGLNKIRLTSLSDYTDLPLAARIFVEHIDSFRRVRDVNAAEIGDVAPSGYLNLSEDTIQSALERILDVLHHQKDWGGEINDLYTANLRINGERQETAFLLKGHGLRKPVMEISDCGTNGDQLLRLMRSPAKVFVVQFVGHISQAVIADIDGKVQLARSGGREAWYCIIDGQDTARLLRAYGHI